MPQNSTLLDLPVELRHEIYHHLFYKTWLTFETHPKAIDIFQKDHPFWILQPPEAQILQTCKQIYAEVSLFLGKYTFTQLKFRGLDGILLLKRYSNVARRSRLKHFHGVSVGAHYQYGRYLSNFAKLETVHITCFQACYAGAEETFKESSYHDDLQVLTSSGVDTIGPRALFERQKQFNWKSLLVDAWFYFDVAATLRRSSGERVAIPCTFDLLSQTVRKDWVRRMPVRYETNGPVYPNPYDSPSALAEREYGQYAQDQSILRERYARFLEHNPGKAPQLRNKRKLELRSKP